MKYIVNKTSNIIKSKAIEFIEKENRIKVTQGDVCNVSNLNFFMIDVTEDIEIIENKYKYNANTDSIIENPEYVEEKQKLYTFNQFMDNFKSDELVLIYNSIDPIVQIMLDRVRFTTTKINTEDIRTKQGLDYLLLNELISLETYNKTI